MSAMTNGQDIHVRKACCRGVIGTVARSAGFLAQGHFPSDDKTVVFR